MNDLMKEELKKNIINTGPRRLIPRYRNDLFTIIHPRNSFLIWIFGNRPLALKVWLPTFWSLTLKEWWSDRPWKRFKYES